MLSFHFLNVGHGSSVIVEHCLDNERSVGVIDSNCNAGVTPKALGKLRQLGVDRLDFLCITHPHRDHFSGIYDIANAFNVGKLYTFPMGDLINNRGRLKKLASSLVELQNRGEGDERRAAHELMQIIKWAHDKQIDWDEMVGPQNRLGPPGFSDVEIYVVAPQPAAKGDYFQRIDANDPTLFGNVKDNELSLALQFRYNGRTILVGGDATASNWRARRRFEQNTNSKIDANAINLPHHGSAVDSSAEVLSNLFSSDCGNVGITSANGITHPDTEVIGKRPTRAILAAGGARLVMVRHG